MVLDLLDTGFYKLSHTLVGVGYGARVGSRPRAELRARYWIAGFSYRTRDIVIVEGVKTKQRAKTK